MKNDIYAQYAPLPYDRCYSAVGFTMSVSVYIYCYKFQAFCTKRVMGRRQNIGCEDGEDPEETALNVSSGKGIFLEAHDKKKSSS